MKKSLKLLILLVLIVFFGLNYSLSYTDVFPLTGVQINGNGNGKIKQIRGENSTLYWGTERTDFWDTPRSFYWDIERNSEAIYWKFSRTDFWDIPRTDFWDLSRKSNIVYSNPTYSVLYDGNGNDSGTVPTDSNEYESGDTVTVLDNTGTLARDGYTFSGWNTAADGSGTDYAAEVAFEISGDVTLYAKWAASNPVIELTVPAVPTIASTTGVISEDQISADALELTVPAVPIISVSTEVDETP